MLDIYELLKIDKDKICNFDVLACSIDDYQMQNTLNKNIRKLNAIGDRMLASGDGINVSKKSIEEVIEKVRKSFRSKNSAEWTMSELRIVSYYLMELKDNNDMYSYALSLLDNGWRNMYFNGLVFYVMNSWNMLSAEQRRLTCRLIHKKLQQYKDNNRRYVILKNHADFFEEGGPARMLALLISKNIDIKDAPTVLGCKPRNLSQSYYSDVIIGYFDKKNVDMDFIDDFFSEYGDSRTKKLVLANLVEKAERRGNAIEQQRVCKFINRVLGDVTLESTWAPFMWATEKDIHRLEHAMQVVSSWFYRQVIEVFFEVCVQDKTRKDFWLKFVSLNYFSSLKIVGTETTKRLLSNDPRVNSIFRPHFIETDLRTSQTSALMLFVKNKVLVEFSDKGALYVYNNTHPKLNFLKRKYKTIHSTDDLKDTSMDTIIQYAGTGYEIYNNEGRLTHVGYWQERLSKWMQIKIGRDTVSQPVNSHRVKEKENYSRKSEPQYEQDNFRNWQPEHRNLVKSEKNTFLDEPVMKKETESTVVNDTNNKSSVFVPSTYDENSDVKGLNTNTIRKKIGSFELEYVDKVLFKTGLFCKLKSCDIFEGQSRIRVVYVEHQGFFCYLVNKDIFAKICSFNGPNESILTNIYVCFERNGYYRIFLSVKGIYDKAKYIGYIKKEEDVVLFMIEKNDKPLLKIPL